MLQYDATSQITRIPKPQQDSEQLHQFLRKIGTYAEENQ